MDTYDYSKTKQRRLTALIPAVLIPLAVGGLSAVLTSGAMGQYADMNKPFLSPPGWAFPVVWTLLYIVMGIASYLVFVSDKERRLKCYALAAYAAQLVLNFFWSILFFSYALYLAAFIWLMVMWVLVLVCTVLFMKISRPAGLMMVPYVVWATFAAYLNLAVYIMSITPMPI